MRKLTCDPKAGAGLGPHTQNWLAPFSWFLEGISWQAPVLFYFHNCLEKR